MKMFFVTPEGDALGVLSGNIESAYRAHEKEIIRASVVDYDNDNQSWVANSCDILEIKNPFCFRAASKKGAVDLEENLLNANFKNYVASN